MQALSPALLWKWSNTRQKESLAHHFMIGLQKQRESVWTHCRWKIKLKGTCIHILWIFSPSLCCQRWSADSQQLYSLIAYLFVVTVIRVEPFGLVNDGRSSGTVNKRTQECTERVAVISAMKMVTLLLSLTSSTIDMLQVAIGLTDFIHFTRILKRSR